MNTLILASASPRRRELLANAHIPFTVLVSEADETLPPCITAPEDIVLYLSGRKASDVAGRLEKNCDLSSCLHVRPDDTIFILGADTVVAVDGEILGKPADGDDARSMLRMIAGREHDVFTGVTILRFQNGIVRESDVFYSKTGVSVAPLTDDEIDWYIATGEPMDKAGAYGIQGAFSRYIRHIDGDYANVVGLPVGKVYRHLVMDGYHFHEQ